jgi:hypothetical protein
MQRLASVVGTMHDQLRRTMPAGAELHIDDRLPGWGSDADWDLCTTIVGDVLLANESELRRLVDFWIASACAEGGNRAARTAYLHVIDQGDGARVTLVLPKVKAQLAEKKRAKRKL